jgi:hypothetical protein
MSHQTILASQLIDDLRKMNFSLSYNLSLLPNFIAAQNHNQIEKIKRIVSVHSLFLQIIDTSLFHYLPPPLMTANSSLLITSINKSINDIQIILFSQDNSLSYDQEVPLSDHMASIRL